MDYFFYNTDASSLFDTPKHRFPILIEHNFAAVGGDRVHFGEQLNKLKLNDILLMYENTIGVVAVGKVLEDWDGIQHKESWYYTPKEMNSPAAHGNEYRIKVEWFLDLSDNPWSIEQIRKSFKSEYFTPRGTITKSDKHRLEIEDFIGEKLYCFEIQEIDQKEPVLRKEENINRILRNTKKAQYVKFLNGFHCQICGHTINLPNGQKYAEAHHIKPLGMPHNGPDIIGNILCVCPNHHVELDFGVISIDLSTLKINSGILPDKQYINYHNSNIYNKK